MMRDWDVNEIRKGTILLGERRIGKELKPVKLIKEKNGFREEGEGILKKEQIMEIKEVYRGDVKIDKWKGLFMRVESKEKDLIRMVGIRGPKKRDRRDKSESKEGSLSLSLMSLRRLNSGIRFISLKGVGICVCLLGKTILKVQERSYQLLEDLERRRQQCDKSIREVGMLIQNEDRVRRLQCIIDKRGRLLTNNEKINVGEWELNGIYYKLNDKRIVMVLEEVIEVKVGKNRVVSIPKKGIGQEYEEE